LIELNTCIRNSLIQHVAIQIIATIDL